MGGGEDKKNGVQTDSPTLPLSQPPPLLHQSADLQPELVADLNDLALSHRSIADAQLQRLVASLVAGTHRTARE